MLAQRLRHRIDIQACTFTQDENTGAKVPVWESIFVEILDGIPVGTGELLPAEIVPLSGREFLAADALQAGVDTRITVPYHPGIVALQRVLHEGDVYDIRAVLPDKTLRRHITLMCLKGVNNG